MRPSQIFKQIVFASAVFLATSCAGERIDELERRTDAALAELRSIQAEHSASINEINSELRTLTGKVDETQYVSIGKTRELERNLQRLGSRVPPPPGVPEDLLAADEEAIASISSPAAELYKQALSQLRSGDIEEARREFGKFVEQNPGTSFTDNGLFWLGICYTKLGQYDRAIVAFSDVFLKYPAEDMVPAALYYQAEAFIKGGVPQDATLSLQKLIDEHPRSPFAAKARNRLMEVKKNRAPVAAPARRR